MTKDMHFSVRVLCFLTMTSFCLRPALAQQTARRTNQVRISNEYNRRRPQKAKGVISRETAPSGQGQDLLTTEAASPAAQAPRLLFLASPPAVLQLWAPPEGETPALGAAWLDRDSGLAFANPASNGNIHPAAPTNDTFKGGTGLWSTAANWSAGLPTASSNVLITGAGSADSVKQDISATINNMTLDKGDSWTLNNGETLRDC